MALSDGRFKQLHNHEICVGKKVVGLRVSCDGFGFLRVTYIGFGALFNEGDAHTRSGTSTYVLQQRGRERRC